MQLAFAPFAYARPDYGLAEHRLVNMYVEGTPAGPTKDARLPRPGLVQAYTVGPGPIWGFYQEPGVFGGDRFAVSGDGLYRETTSLGPITVTRNVRFAASTSQLVVVSGGNAYCYDGTSLTQIDDEDLPDVSDVVYLAGRFYYLEQDSDRWWYSDLDDATAIDGLSFATAESSPDASVGAIVLSDEIWFFGLKSVEPWYQTGDPDNPLQRAPGRKYERGCAAQGSIVKLDNGVFWVGEDRIVYRAGAVPLRVSTYGVEAKLRACASIADCTAWHCAFDGHVFYVLNIPGEATFAYDTSTQLWSEFASYGRTGLRVRNAVMQEGIAYLGDAEDGVIWRFDATAYSDGDDPVQRVASAALLLPGSTLPCWSVMLQASRGVGLEDGSEPLVELRYSDDGGRTWSDWDARSLGRIGEYGKKAIWRNRGRMRSPGRIFEVRCADPVGVVFSGLIINEARP